LNTSKVLTGTAREPTTLTFGAIRSSHFDEFQGKTDGDGITKYALQLFWRGTKKILGLSTAAGSAPTHVVAFRFQVEENVYISKLTRKLNFSSMLSVLIAYTLTALSVLGVGKKLLQKIIDAVLLNRAEKENAKAPTDVLRRQAVLDEHAITSLSGRRISSVVLDGVSGGDIELPTLSAEDGRINPLYTGEDAVPSLPPRQPRPSNQVRNMEHERKIASLEKTVISLEKTVARLMKHLSLTPTIKDTAPSKLHRNPHWNKLKQSVFKSGSKNRTKRLSKVIKARRNSAALEQEENNTTIEIDEETGHRYSYNASTGETAWLEQEDE
jgi:hypothetical protein